MARTDAHTRIVTLLKVVLPLAALAILSTLFLLADKIDPEDALPYAEVDVEDLAREPRMTLPSYAGTTSDGAALSLTAGSAMPGTADRPAEARDVRVELTTPDGVKTELNAASAVLDPAGKTARLSGGVTMTTSLGYTLETREVLVGLDQSTLSAITQVTVFSPAGKITAAGMELGRDNQTPGAYLMVFKGDVRLVYLPGG